MSAEIIGTALVAFAIGAVYGLLVSRWEGRQYRAHLRQGAEIIESLLQNLPHWSGQRRRPVDFIERWKS